MLQLLAFDLLSRLPRHTRPISTSEFSGGSNFGPDFSGRRGLYTATAGHCSEAGLSRGIVVTSPPVARRYRIVSRIVGGQARVRTVPTRPIRTVVDAVGNFYPSENAAPEVVRRAQAFLTAGSHTAQELTMLVDELRHLEFDGGSAGEVPMVVENARATLPGVLSALAAVLETIAMLVGPFGQLEVSESPEPTSAR